ncbi:amino acid adenylation domain-containing protein [Sorangium sp. So ce269]
MADNSMMKRLEGISPAKRELLMQMLERKKGASEPQAIPRRSSGDPPPLSFAQQRFWFLDQWEPGQALYNIPAAVRLEGPLDVELFVRALREIIQRHEALRTAFQTVDGRAAQVIAPSVAFDVPVEALEQLPPAEQDAEVHRRLEQEVATPFDLSRPPLIRVRLLRLGGAKHVCTVTMHHIVSDGWSIGVFVKELAALYTALHAGRPSPLPELPIQYADYALWQQRWLKGEARDAQLAYWKKHLAGAPPLELPTDRPRPPVQRWNGATYAFQLSPSLAAGVDALNQRARSTRFMTLLAAFQLLLSRYSGAEDICVGSFVAGRNRSQLEGLIGLFINTIALRADLSGDPTVLSLLERVRATTLAAYDAQDIPFEHVLDALQLPRDLSRTPLFQVAFVLHNTPLPSLTLPNLRLSQVEIEWKTALFDLKMELQDTPEGMRGWLVYNTDLWDAPSIARMIEHYKVLLEGMISAPERRVSALPLLTPGERRQILGEWSALRSTYAADTCVHRLFEAQVERAPEAIALSVDGTQVTYRELNRRANRLARRLQALGVGPDIPVALCLERSVEMMVGILGVLKAGGAYVPLDPAYPRARIEYMLEDSQAPVLLTDAPRRAALPPYAGRVLLAESDWGDSADAGDVNDPGDVNAESAVQPSNLAYIIYTSGSTGKPKGALLEHRHVERLFHATQAWFGFDERDVWTMFHSYAFDFSVWEIWGALIHGGRLVIVPFDVSRAPEAFLDLLCRERVTVLNQTPSAFRQLVRADAARERPAALSLRFVIFGGEGVDLKSLRPWYERHGDERPLLVNMYGITETTVHVTYRPLSAADLDSPVSSPIGVTIPDLQTYLLDSRMEPVPVGVPGEIYVGGAGVARGYLNRGELTAQRFVADPFSSEPGARLYRSGDRARWLPDGTMDHLGRIDHQVKIRGFRIELDEIDAALARHPAVGEVAVLVREDTADDKRLVAYLIPRSGQPCSSAELRSFLKEKLPEYMVPSAFVWLEAFPLTTNGKLDRRALPSPAQVRSTTDKAFAPPRAGAEQTLADIWAEVLGAERVGADDNFFELGGDSILSVQIVARARQAGLELTPKHVFEYQTIAELAAVAGSARAVSAEQGLMTGAAPLSPIQRWFFEQELAEPHHFNQAILLELHRPAAPEVLAAALDELLRHHDALRLRFTRSASGWEQAYAPPADAAPLSLVDLSALPAAERATALAARAAELQASLDLARGPVLRAALFHLGADLPARLLLVVHHLVIDGVSWRILLEDLQTLLDQRAQGAPARLPPKTTSLRHWMDRLAQHAGSEAIRRELPAWLDALSAPAARLPVDFPRGESTAGSARSLDVSLPAEETRALLQEVPAAYRTQINDVLLTAWALAMSRWTKEPVTLLDLEGHGREDIGPDVDVTRTVGWFTTIFPVRLDLTGREGLGEALCAVKEQLRAVPGHGLGYMLLRYLNDAPEIAGAPSPEVLFNYLGQVDATLGASSWFTPTQEPCGPVRSPRGRRTHALEVTALVAGGSLQLSFVYSDALHRPGTIQALADGFLGALRALIAHCRSPGVGGYTPSDFPLARLDQRALDRLVGKDRRIEDVYPLTPVQQGMLFHSLHAPGSGVYVEQILCSLAGDLDAPALLRSWQRVLDRHPSLRGAMVWEDLDAPLQIVREGGSVRAPMDEHDWRGLPPDERESRFSAFLQADRTRGFELSRAPLLRLALFRMEDSAYRFVWSYHHMLLDGWSVPLLLQEIFALYEAASQGRDVELPRRRAYRDYVRWLGQKDLAEAEAFWRRTLRGFTAPTPLLVDPRPIRASAPVEGYGDITREIGAGAVASLSSFARSHRLTLNTLTQGAWSLLLSRYSGETDIVFGATVSGRPTDMEGAEQMVGVFINTLPIRVQVSPEMSVRSFLQACQEAQVQTRHHEHTPLSQVQAWSDVPRGQSLFETILVFENFPHDEEPTRLGGLEIKDVRSLEQTNYPLTVILAPTADRLLLRILHDRSRFDATVVERMLEHFGTLLEALAADLDRPVASLPMLTPEERRHLVAGQNDTRADFTEEGLIHELIEAQVARTPRAVAVTFEGQELTYEQLNRRANQLAHRLRARGIGPDSLVGIAAERSLEMVVGLLGILKAGGAYVPIDPSYPADRLRYILEEVRPAVLLTQEHLRGAVPHGDAEVLCLDSDWPAIARERDDDPRSGVTGRHLAYAIYTSGSTGRPKGVMNVHAGFRNRLLWMQRAYQLTPDDAVLQKTPYSFDVSVWEFFWPLFTGARLVVARPEGHRDVTYLIELIRSQEVTTLHFVPSMLQPMVDDAGFGSCTTLKRVICSGEALPFELQERFFARSRAELHNLYGPTEASIDVTYWPCQPGDPRRIVPIGWPIANTQLYVLDARLDPAPVGVPGELYIGGVGVARGYIGRPELTADRFIPDPFGQTPGMRLYKTGDLARWLEDGSIEYLGRLDHQVKIRGFRIELGEIEAVLGQHPAVREAVVLAREDVPGDKRLAAYVVPRDGAELSAAELRGCLAEALPSYMVPAAFVVLEALPLTHSGKVDRRALPPPDAGRASAERAIVAPRTPAEETLVSVLQQVLNVGQVSLHDNFFDLGGDSILAIQVVNKAQRAGLKLLLRHILEHPTAAELAQAAAPVEDGLEERAVAVAAEQGLVTGEVPLTPIQHWLFERALNNPHHFNQDMFAEVGEPLDPALLRAAIRELLCHHDALRLRVTREAGALRQRIDPPGGDVPLALFDLSSVPPGRQPEAIEQAAASLQESLRLDDGPLLRVGLFDLGPGRAGRLCIVIHHLAVDGVSWRVLTEDLQTAIAQLREGQPVRLPPKTTSFKQWAERLSAHAQSGAVHREMSHWLGVASAPPLPVDVTLGANTCASARTVKVTLDPGETRALLQDVPEVYGTRINDALLTALGLALAPCTGSRSVRVDLEGHGREAFDEGVDVSRTVGWFTSLFPVRLELPDGPPEQALLAVQEQLRALPGRGLGYGLLRYLHADPAVRGALAAAPRGQVIFNYLGQFNQGMSADSMFRPAKESSGPSIDPSEPREHAIEINGLVTEGRLHLEWTYSENLHRRSTIEQMAERYMGALRALIAASASPEAERRRRERSAGAPARPGAGAPPASSLLVRIQPGRAGRPLFCVHAGGGTVLFYAELARHLGAQRPVYGIQARGAEDDQPPNRRVEDMAAQYVDALRAVQPEGPYLLSGYSFGALVVFEMAHQLSAAGHALGLVALIDMPPESSAGVYEGWDDAMILADIGRLQGLDIPVEALRKMPLQEQIDHVVGAARAAQALPANVGARDLARLLAIYKAHNEARLSYRPPVSDSRVTLFRVRRDAPEPTGWPDDIRRDPTLGWSRYCRHPVEVQEVPGEHETLLKEPNVRVQAELLRLRLREADPAQ